MRIRNVDKDLNVYNESGKASNLASRGYMQELKRSGEPQITDSFLAGADGKTVNFTVAVAIERDGKFDGVLLAAIYEKKFSEVLTANEAILMGKKQQFMSGIDEDRYGTLLDTELDGMLLFGGNKARHMLEIKDADVDSGAFWGFRSGLPTIYAFAGIEHTGWNVVSRVSFADGIADHVLACVMLTLAMAGTIFLLVGAIVFRKRFFAQGAEKEKSDSAER